MYFFKQKGRQILDLRGNLILTHNKNLVTGRIKSAVPASVRNAKYISVASFGIYRKIKATFHAIGFIWGSSTALTEEEINKERM